MQKCCSLGGLVTALQFFCNFPQFPHIFLQFPRNFSQLDLTLPDRNPPPPPSGRLRTLQSQRPPFVSPTSSSFDTGTIFWMAPEVLQERNYGVEVDIWSIGATVMEMVTAQRPWMHTGVLL